MKINKKHGFILIELLVVITIMWILAVGWISIYTSQMQKARDSTRLNDVIALQGAFEQFYMDMVQYPNTLAHWNSTTAVSIKSFLPNYVNDPNTPRAVSTVIPNCGLSKCVYITTSVSPAGKPTFSEYEVSTAFENVWNASAKAIDTYDKWNDPNRYEIWINVAATTQKTDFASTTAKSTPANTTGSVGASGVKIWVWINWPFTM